MAGKKGLSDLGELTAHAEPREGEVRRLVAQGLRRIRAGSEFAKSDRPTEPAKTRSPEKTSTSPSTRKMQ